jgi:DNA polymerase-3 subunit epsilon
LKRMRQIILDTETTGLEPSEGHRIIEIGCIELIDRRPSGGSFHQYLQPDRDIDAGAIEVHGITNDDLADKPRFADIAADFVAFIDGAELVIHNAPFDLGFIRHEIELAGMAWEAIAARITVTDTLALARSRHPGQKNNLDALCKRYGIDNSQRTLHGALLDAEILAEVYLAMTGGQSALLLDEIVQSRSVETVSEIQRLSAGRAPLRVVRATAEERHLHAERIRDIDNAAAGGCLWLQLEDVTTH